MIYPCLYTEVFTSLKFPEVTKIIIILQISGIVEILRLRHFILIFGGVTDLWYHRRRLNSSYPVCCLQIRYLSKELWTVVTYTLSSHPWIGTGPTVPSVEWFVEAPVRGHPSSGTSTRSEGCYDMKKVGVRNMDGEGEIYGVSKSVVHKNSTNGVGGSEPPPPKLYSGPNKNLEKGGSTRHRQHIVRSSSVPWSEVKTM